MFKIEAKSKLIFMGDSITDAGRSRPSGEGLFDPLGGGYVSFINALINSTYPEGPIRVVNKGNSGDTSRSMLKRWKEDCIDQNPDWVSIMIGINDVWRQFDMALYPEELVLIEEYEKNLVEMLESLNGNVKGIILCTPFFIESNIQDEMRNRMDKYSAVVKKLAEKYNTVFVDMQEAFNSALKHHYSARFAWDRVHPNNTGHMILARAFLKAIGYEF